MKASRNSIKLILVSALFVFSFSKTAFAVSSDSFGNDFDDDEPAQQLAASVVHRDYPGIRDEGGLEVQASLPVPSRSLEGQTQVRLPSDEEPEAHD